MLDTLFSVFTNLHYRQYRIIGGFTNLLTGWHYIKITYMPTAVMTNPAA